METTFDGKMGVEGTENTRSVSQIMVLNSCTEKLSHLEASHHYVDIALLQDLSRVPL
jgi:hypothetical protein